MGSFCFFCILVFLHSCIPPYYVWFSPTAWLRQTVPRFSPSVWDFSPAPLPIIRTYAEQVKGKIKKEVWRLESETQE
jgi:hypothetical protein